MKFPTWMLISFLALLFMAVPILAGNQYQAGSALPQISLEDLASSGQKTLQSYQGKPLLLDFWASWCVPCGKSLPKLEALQKKYLGVEIVGVNLDNKKEKAQKFLDKLGVKSLRHLYDSKKALAESLDIGGMPTLLLCDEKGIIQMRIDGYSYSEMDELESKLQKLAKAQK